MFGFKNEHARKEEIKRLEKIKPDFMRELTELSLKYHCQLVPVPEILPGNGIRFSLQLDSFWPIEKPKAEEKKSDKTE